MTAVELFRELRRLGVDIQLNGENLKVGTTPGSVPAELLAEIRALKPELVKILRLRGGRQGFSSIPPVEKREYYPLSSAQKRLYLLHRLDPGSTAYNMPYILPVSPDSRREEIEASFRRLISRHESLRTSFRLFGDLPVQRVHSDAGFTVREIRSEQPFESIRREEYIRPFDLGQAPLLRVSLVRSPGGSSVLVIDMHHVISDGISHQVMEQDFIRLTFGANVPPLRLQYRDYSQWQNGAEQHRRMREQEAYWMRRFEGDVPVLELPVDFPRPAVQSFEGATVGFSLSAAATGRLKALARERGMTLYMVVLSVYALLVAKLSGQDDIVIGTPIAGRRHADLEKIVGMFVNTLALRVRVNPNQPVRAFLEEIKQSTLEAFDHQEYQFEDLVERVSVVRDVSRNPLFDVMFNYLSQERNAPDAAVDAAGEPRHAPGVSKFDLTLLAMDQGEGLRFSLSYCTELFRPESMNRFALFAEQLAEQLPLKLDHPVGGVTLVSEQEERHLLYDLNRTAADYPKGMTIVALFEEQVRRHPDKIALAFGEEQLSYLELDRRSSLLSARMGAEGVKPFDIVGLLTDRTPEMLIGTLSILKRGGVYLPLDAGYPASRLEYMIRDCSASTVLAGEGLGEGLAGLCRVVGIGGAPGTPGAFTEPPSARCPHAYVMYTSGSTGKPKGVLVEQQGVLRLVRNVGYVSLTPDTVILQAGAIVFDATTFEIWAALLNGGRLVLEEKGNLLSAAKLGVILRKQDVNTLLLSTSLFNLLVQDDARIFSRVKWLLSGGEVMSPGHAHRARAANPGLNLVNAYGPTENTTISSAYRVAEALGHSVPIGTPISNSTCYVLDRSKRLQPGLVVGELYVGGDGLAAGYLNNPELTDEKFIAGLAGIGGRLYRTGDLARWAPDGNLQYMGRADSQVKIRGFRIELGEVERVLERHEHVKECLAVVQEKEGEKMLCAYTVLVSGADFSAQSLRDFMAGLLPVYLIPAYFIPVDRMPLTASGKVNRKALPLPEARAGADHAAPSDELEAKLVAIWADILKLPPGEISTTANFFEIGGHSLRATIFTNRLFEELNVELKLRDFFSHATVKGVSALIKSSAGVLEEGFEEISL